MSDTKHTTGSWEVVDAIYDYKVICNDNYKSIAVMSNPKSTETKANAILMAASPDLLFALKELVWNVKSLDDIKELPVMAQILKFSEAAIKKATI